MYSFIALPEESILQKLNNIRKYLYNNGFRYSTNSPTSDVHISLFHFVDYPNESLLNKLKGYDQLIINNYELVNRPHDDNTNKVDQPSNWIALQFKSFELTQLADEVINFLGINSEISADHMNLCNYARPEKSQEAIEYIKSMNLPESFLINLIAIRNDHGDLLWTMKLK